MTEPEERDKIRADKRAFVKEIMGHVIALMLVIGFFVIALMVFLGYVELKDASIALAVGSIIGYAAGNIAPVTIFYYGAKPEKYKENEPK